MSEALELVRSIFEAWAVGDFSSVEWADAAIILVIVGGPLTGSWRGLAEVAHAARAVFDQWEDLRIEADLYGTLSSEHVVAVTHTTARSGSERYPVGVNPAVVFQVKDGKVARLVIYWDGDRTRAEAGLDE
jgi:ketosteroid isomerase-like protein